LEKEVHNIKKFIDDLEPFICIDIKE